MNINEWINDFITLRGEEIPLKIGYLQQSKLKFFPENPRIYSIISALDTEPSQTEIETMLIQREHVKQLIHSIKANGGLTDPIFVQDNSFIVLEGNSRLAAYRALSYKDPIKWGRVKCKVLPKEIDEDKIFSLLGEYHIIGKQDWAPYEQAGYLYRRFKHYDTNPQKMAGDLGLTIKAVNHLIEVYSFMVEHEDNDPSRWSYYDEYLKSRKIKKCREKHPNFDEVIVSKIKSGEIFRAADIRDNLTKIVVAGNKIINYLLTEKIDFQECVERAISGGADEHCLQNIKKFRNWIVDPKVIDEIKEMPEKIAHKIKFELRKIKSGIEHIEKYLTK